MDKKIALVTGAGTGIGRGIALELAAAGYDIAVHYNSTASGAQEVCALARKSGVRAEAIGADLSQKSGVDLLFSKTEELFGQLDLFVANAGVTLTAPFLETTEQMLDKMYAVDFKGTFLCMQAASRLMIKHGTAGSIVVISSNNAYTHFANASAYGSIKSAVTKLAEHAALELSKYKIRVNTIAPGWTDTGSARLDDKQSTYYKIPLKRWATPSEIGQAVLYFGSPYCGSVSGSTLVIDGAARLLSDKGSRYGFDE